MENKLMYECWRLGFKIPKIIEYFSENGVYITEWDVELLFRKVIESYFEKGE